MTIKMLIDATHPEETRVAVVDGTRLEEFDFEMAARRQIKSNIYLAKVTRVEPSLQAAFVEYGGNRHGFLPFPEIHPDYYRIPVGDRALRNSDREERWVDTPYVAAETSPDDAAENAEWASAEDGRSDAAPRQPAPFDDETESSADETSQADESADHHGESVEGDDEPVALHAEIEAPDPEQPAAPEHLAESEQPAEPAAEQGEDQAPNAPGSVAAAAAADPMISETVDEVDLFIAEQAFASEPDENPGEENPGQAEPFARPVQDEAGEDSYDEPVETSSDVGAASVETVAEDAAETIDIVGGDEVEDAQRRRRSQMPHYKIQEVIKRRQIMLVQVSKEERGNKGAAVTTFLSLPGRYCVLMPNTSRGGGVSRKIANPADRKRMKELISDLEVPEGMSVILRTAGVERSKAEIKRDLEYLLRLWESIRALTLESTAPALIYEEGNLVKRAIRDLYTKDIESIEIAGEEGYRQAKDFMRMLMPSHAKRVQPYRDPSIPLFFRYQVESQIDLIHNPVAHLKSGGYIVINQTEALVSIDVNSGRSTRERNIEETALKTNLEAADEIARQLRLRDMGGLIVIDFIDMDEPRHDGHVERRLKEAMKNDRARIQVGRISPFGLLELSRQRLHPSLVETHFQTCAHCLGTGLVRSIESASLLVLRAIEEEGIKRRSAELAVTVAGNIALYILNQKRGMLIDIENRYGFSVRISADDSLIAPEHRIERVRLKPPGSELPPLTQTQIMASDPEDEEEDENDEIEESGETPAIGAEEANGAGSEGDRKRKRRRNRRRRGRDGRPEDGAADDGQAEEGHAEAQGEGADEDSFDAEDSDARLDEQTEDSEDTQEDPAADSAPGLELGSAHAGETSADGARRRRRGRRGGRSRARREDGRLGALPGSDPAGEDGTPSENGLPDDDDTDAAILEPHEAGLAATDERRETVEAPIAESEASLTPSAQPESPMSDDAASGAIISEPDAPPAEPANGVAEEPATAEPEPALLEAEAEVVEEAPQPALAAAEAAPPNFAPKPYEIVNQPPAQPKRGFWKRLVE
jgi:ribonuclease E